MKVMCLSTSGKDVANNSMMTVNPSGTDQHGSGGGGADARHWSPSLHVRVGRPVSTQSLSSAFVV